MLDGPRLRSGSSVVDAVLAVGCGAVAFLLALAPVNDVDFFWHLAVGRHVAEHGALPGKNLWSFTAPEHPFEATAWAFDLCAFLVHRAFGVGGVQLVVAAVLGAAFALAYLTARRLGAPRTLAAALTATAALASQSRLSQRPQAVTYALLALAAYLVARGGRWRWALPPLVAVWSNFHAGCVFGAGLVGLVAISHWLERFRGKAHDAVRWSACAAACVVALTLNPSGAGEVRYALFHLGSVTNVVDLAEFQSPPLITHGGFWFVFGLGVLAVALRAVDDAPRLRSANSFGLHVLILLAFGVMAARAMYVAPMFSLVTVPFTAVALGPFLRPFLAPIAPLAALLLAPEPASHFLKRIHLGVDPFRVPEAAARAVPTLGLSGRVFTSWDLAGFVEWALPGSPVYADPRLLAYPPEVFTALSKAEESQAAFDALMDQHQVAWAFRSHRVLRMSGLGRFPRERWALLHWDEAAAIYVRRELLGDRTEVKLFLPAAPVLESFSTLKGEDRETWWREARAAAEQSPLLASAQIAACLEHHKRGDEAAAREACDLAVMGIEERERYHPLEGQARRNEAGVAIALLGDPARALTVSRESPEVLTALGGMALATDKAKALGYFERALQKRPDFPPALKGRDVAQR